MKQEFWWFPAFSYNTLSSLLGRNMNVNDFSGIINDSRNTDNDCIF